MPTSEITQEAPKGRIKAYGINCTWVFLVGLGSENAFGTFPRRWLVSDLLAKPSWIQLIRKPEWNEKPLEGVHYNFLCRGWMPTEVFFVQPSGSFIRVMMNEMLGAYDAAYLQLYQRAADVPVLEGSFLCKLLPHDPEIATPTFPGSSDGDCSDWMA